MSLVNDMLKDLESRWPGHDNAPLTESEKAAENKVENLGPALGHYRGERRIQGPLLLVLVGALIFVFLIVLGREDVIEVAVAQAPQAESEKIQLTSQSVPTASPQADIDLSPAGTTTTPPAIDLSAQRADDESTLIEQHQPTEQPLELLFHSAERSLRRDRLTRPKRDNAYDYYMEILRISPAHPRALEGLRQIEQRYVQLLDAAIENAEVSRAKALAISAQDVGVNEKELAKRLAKLELLKQPLAEKTSASVAPDVKSETLQNTKANTAEGSLQSVSESLASRDRRVVDSAQRLQQSGQLNEAVTELESFIADEPGAIKSVEALFSFYLQSNQESQAERLMVSSEHLPEQTRAFMKAQLKVKNQEYQAALNALKGHATAAADNPPYSALLAAVYHKLGQHSQSAALYRELLKVDFSNTAYWLGLAVSLDKSRQPGALGAFQKLRQLSRGSESYFSYVDARIQALSLSQR